MVNYHVRRFGQAAITIFAVVSFSFFLIRLLPGGPFDYLRAQIAQQAAESGGDTSMEQARLMEEHTNINPDKPVIEQYLDYLLSVVQGDFGRSFWYDEPVADIIFNALPWTLLVMSVSLIAGFTIGILLGAVMAYLEGSNFDFGMTIASIFSGTVPYYVFALLLLGTFAFSVTWFPSGGQVAGDISPNQPFDYILSVLYHATLPILSMTIALFGAIALQMRGNSIQILGSDYIRVARLRGLSKSRISTYYVAKNAVLPLYTRFMISLSFMFGGSVVLEQIFAYPGVGFYLLRGFQARDYPLMMMGFILITTITVLGVLVADLTYGYIDPRIQTGDQNA